MTVAQWQNPGLFVGNYEVKLLVLGTVDTAFIPIFIIFHQSQYLVPSLSLLKLYTCSKKTLVLHGNTSVNLYTQ